MGGETALTPRLKAVLDELPALVVVLRGERLEVEIANPRRPGLPRGAEVQGMPAEQMLEVVLAEPADRERYMRALRWVLETGEPIRELESVLHFVGGESPSYWDIVLLPLRDAPGAPPDGVAIFGTEVTRLVEARRRAEEAEHRFTALFEANFLGVTITDEERILESNDAFLTMVGRTRADLEAGLKWTEITAPGYEDVDARALRALKGTGAVAPYEKVYLRPDGSRVSVLIGGTRLSEQPFRVLATGYDLSDRKAMETEAAALLARTRRLQEVTAALSASSSASAVARAVIHHGLEELQASAGILLREQELTHVVGIDPEVAAEWRAFPATLPAALREPTGRLESAGELMPGGILLAVPIAGAEGAALGVVALLFRQPRAVNELDMDFLLALARQAGLALDRTRLYEDRAYVARKLQEGLLPEQLPAVPGLEAGVVYESISGGGEVGGDFYDLFDAASGRWFACVGDVCGKGTEAAVITGLARHTVRAIARTSERPAEVLAFLNGALRRHAAVPSFCTVGAVSLYPRDAGGFDVMLASGGHPFPLVLRATGELEEVEVTGTMLGAAEQPELIDVSLRINPGDALLLYTDGVIDARRVGGERFGEQRLYDAVRGACGLPAQGIAQAVEAAVRAHLPGASADDRAVMVLRAVP